MEEVCKRLKAVVDLRQIKPIKLAEITGIDKGSISSYLSGRYVPKSKNIYKLAKALNVSPAWLLGYDVPMEETQEDELDILYNQYKKYLTKDDIDRFMFILEKRREENEGVEK